MNGVEEKCRNSLKAFSVLKNASSPEKNYAIFKIGESLILNLDEILKANEEDVSIARKKGIKESLVDRLRLTKERIITMAKSCDQVMDREDPIGKIDYVKKLENGLSISRVRIPIGPIGMIYESRPNVTVDAAILCIKSGNTVVLRGGSDAYMSNNVIVSCIKKALEQTAIPADSVEYLSGKDRSSVNELMKMKDYISLIIPRGGYELIKFVKENSSVPVLETGVGNCHIFVDETADLHKSVEVILNAKTQRPGTCNSVETVLIHEKIAGTFLPMIYKALKESNVEIYGCEKTIRIIDVSKATEDDWQREYLDFKLAVKVVENISEAISHIDKYSTGHSESILTNNLENSILFKEKVDSAAVYVNASTRFTDGDQFGFGAEIGISTQRIVARGPVGLDGLTTYKYVVEGNYNIRG